MTWSLSDPELDRYTWCVYEISPRVYGLFKVWFCGFAVLCDYQMVLQEYVQPLSRQQWARTHSVFLICVESFVSHLCLTSLI